jgi:hypothetical protein
MVINIRGGIKLLFPLQHFAEEEYSFFTMINLYNDYFIPEGIK